MAESEVRIPRRTVLKGLVVLGGLAGSSALLSACGVSSEPPKPTNPEAKPAVAPTIAPAVIASPSMDANPHDLASVSENGQQMAKDTDLTIQRVPGILMEAAFYYDPNYRDRRPEYAKEGSLALRTRFSGSGLWIVVSEQLEPAKDARFLYKDDITKPRVFNGTVNNLDDQLTHPVTGQEDGERDRIYIGVAINPGDPLDQNMKTYEVIRRGTQETARFIGYNPLDVRNLKTYG
jgi:hypothetical protein